MQNIAIKKFGTKLMVSSKSVNKIPDEYLKYAQNCRIYDGGIGPAKGKQLLIESLLGTNNKGAFYMNDILYQICNIAIYSINLTTGEQTLVVSLGYDEKTDVLVYGKNIAIIVSNGKSLKVFNGTTISTPTTVPTTNTGIIEYCRGFSFLASGNVLYISKPIVASNPEYSYDFTSSGSQTITYDSDITGLKSTMNGIYIFTKSKVEYIGANSLQNIAGSATFISTPLGEGGEPINNLCISASGEKIFYITKNKQVKTINYISGTSDPTIGELSSRPIISMKEFLLNLDTEQNNAFSFFNKNDNTIQFHIKTTNYLYNDICLVYDLINDTWCIDKGKYYNYVIEIGEQYYGFSDINSSIYKDDYGYSMARSPIPFLIQTQRMNQGGILQKLYGGIFTAGAIGPFTKLDYKVLIDDYSEFLEEIEGNKNNINGLGEIGGQEIGSLAIGGDLTYNYELEPFERLADEGRIFEHGKRIQIEISSSSQIQDFIIDMLGVRAEFTNYINIEDKF